MRAFKAVKEMLTADIVLALYDPHKETTVAADASSHGLGAVLLQRHDDGQDRPVAFASRAMSETEQRYAQIEKEALAVTWACEKFSEYLIGLTFKIELIISHWCHYWAIRDLMTCHREYNALECGS